MGKEELQKNEMAVEIMDSDLENATGGENQNSEKKNYSGRCPGNKGS